LINLQLITFTEKLSDDFNLSLLPWLPSGFPNFYKISTWKLFSSPFKEKNFQPKSPKKKTSKIFFPDKFIDTWDGSLSPESVPF